MSTKVDDRGRVLIPKEIRQAANLEPGRSVRVELDEDGHPVIRPVRSPEAFLDRLVGAISEETRRSDAEPTDPLEVKAMWEPEP